jgi:hypothetical protein
MRFPICVACGTKDDLQHHHLVPRKVGGGDDEHNLVTLCTACHHKIHQRQMNGDYSHGELVKAGQARARREGRQPGARPYEVDCPEAYALARQLRRERKSIRQIAAALLAAGYAPRRSRTFSPSSVSRMLEGLPKVPQGCRP